MAEEQTLQTEAERPAESDPVIAKMRTDYESQLKGLNRANSALKKELDERSASAKTVEDRIAILEREKQATDRRAATMEAFGKHGLTEDFRSLFDIDDPEDRAITLKGLLENHVKDATKKVASEFLRDPEAPRDGASGRTYTVAQLKGMSPAEINKLWKEGRVKGSAK